MKKLFISMIVMATFSPSAPAFTGGDGDCHFHGNTLAKAETASGCAVRRQQALVAGSKLDKSWQSIKPGTSEQIDGQKGKEWKVIFKDPAAVGKSKANLYMLFTPQGNFIATNFTDS